MSCDSMQIYKGMDIGTAKPTNEEMCGIPHHMLDIVYPSENFSVAQFCEMARTVIKDIHERGKLPILVGGTGLYIDSLINNIEFSDEEGKAPGLIYIALDAEGVRLAEKTETGRNDREYNRYVSASRALNLIRKYTEGGGRP